MRVAVEVCVTSIEEALAAERAGADSVELCTWLACGGVTPSYGLVNTLKELLKIPLRVLVRPTPGGFVYSDHERQAILRDSMLIGMSTVGLVAGALDEDGLPEPKLIKAIRLAAPDREITFHRAVDRSSDMHRALERCLELGLPRVLTSGGETLATDGAVMITHMVQHAGNSARIAAAGGINASNVVELVERTGVAEVHFAAQRPKALAAVGASLSSQHEGVSFGTEPDVAKIEGVLNALAKAGLR